MLLLLAGFAGYERLRSDQPAELTVRITSTDSASPVSFKASYLFKDADSELQVEEGTTPATLTASADVFSGIFRKVEGDADMKVELIKGENMVLSGTGAVVLMTELGGQRYVSDYRE